MGLRAQEPINKIDNVVPGGTASISLAIGNTYDRIYIELGGDLVKAHISNIKLELDGKLVSDWRNVAALEAIQQGYYTRLIDANVIEMVFTLDDILKTVEEGRFFGLGTMGLTTAVITFDISATPAAPVVKAYAEKSAPAAPGYLVQTRKFPFAVSSGQNEITTMPKPAGWKIAAIHVFKTEGDVTKAEFIVDNKSWVNVPKSTLERMSKRYGRTPQANYVHLDFWLQGDMFQTVTFPNAAAIQKGVPPVQDMRLRLDCTTGGNVDVIVEYVAEWTPNGF